MWKYDEGQRRQHLNLILVAYGISVIINNKNSKIRRELIGFVYKLSWNQTHVSHMRAIALHDFRPVENF